MRTLVALHLHVPVLRTKSLPRVVTHYKSCAPSAYFVFHQASVVDCVRCGSLNRISRDGTEIATACTMSSQLETFTKWWNSHLEPRGYPISNLVEDVHSGFLPFRLLEALENHPPTPVVRGKAKILGTAVVAKPQIKMQRMDNHSRFFAFLTEEKNIKVLLLWLPSR